MSTTLKRILSRLDTTAAPKKAQPKPKWKKTYSGMPVKENKQWHDDRKAEGYDLETYGLHSSIAKDPKTDEVMGVYEGEHDVSNGQRPQRWLMVTDN